jgi:hypothetical protein
LNIHTPARVHQHAVLKPQEANPPYRKGPYQMGYSGALPEIHDKKSISEGIILEFICDEEL